jgi:hypothetical protein
MFLAHSNFDEGVAGEAEGLDARLDWLEEGVDVVGERAVDMLGNRCPFCISLPSN